MECLLSTPGLPDAKVSSVLVSFEYKTFITALNNFGIDVLSVYPKDELDESISSHPDCRFIQCNSNHILVDNSISESIVNHLTNKRSIKNLSITTIGESIKSPYPYDVKLNCFIIDKKIICNTKYTSVALKDIANSFNYELVHVNQGYAACSTIVLNNYALITDDESIHNAVIKANVESLFVSKGSVLLKNHEYGFIGGTCGMIDKNLLAFTGDIRSHKDADRILEFLKKHNIEYVNLSEGPLIDIGGIIPLTQSL